MQGTAIYHAPVGELVTTYQDGAVIALKRADATALPEDAPNALTEAVCRQLDEYFAGTRTTFPSGCRERPFRRRSGPPCGTFPTARPAAISRSPRPSGNQRPAAQWAWPTTETRYISSFPATGWWGPTAH